MTVPQKLSFKQQQLIVREDAIVDAVNGLLARKGYELMTLEMKRTHPVTTALWGGAKRALIDGGGRRWRGVYGWVWR